MDNEEKLGILIAVVLLFGGVVWGWWKKRSEAKQVQSALYQQPMLQAGAADGSTARVVGTIVASQGMLTAPLSRKPCVMFWTRIITAMGENKDHIQFVPFVLDRGNEGQVIIDAQFARMDLPTTPVAQGGAEAEQYVAAQGYDIRTAFNAQFYEIILEPGMQVSIAGTVMTDAGQQGYRGAGTTYRIAGNQQHPIVIGRAS